MKNYVTLIAVLSATLAANAAREFDVQAPVYGVEGLLQQRSEFLPAGEFGGIARQAQIPEKPTPQLSMTTVMEKAALEFPTVLMADKEVQAVKKQKSGAFWSQFSVAAGMNKDKSHASPSGGERATSSNTAPGMSMTMSLGFSTWFQMRGLELTTELKQAQKKALQMQLAYESAKIYTDYVNESSRAYFLSQVQKSLLTLKQDVDQGYIQLSEVNYANLGIKLLVLESSLDDVRNKIKLARIDLRKYMGYEPPDLVAGWQTNAAPNQHKVANADERRHDWKLIDWETLDNRFTIPDGPEQAIELARNAPALVVPSLNTKMQEVSWYLALSAAGPSLVFSLNKNWSESEYNGARSSNESDSVNVGLSFRLGGGLLDQLTSIKLLEEAAQLNLRAVRLQLRGELEKSYVSVKAAKKSIVRAEKIFRQHTEALLKANNTVDDGNFDSLLQMYARFEEATSSLITQVGAYNLSRISILASTGTLLDELTSAQKPPITATKGRP